MFAQTENTGVRLLSIKDSRKAGYRVSFAILFRGNPQPQYYVAYSAMHAMSIARMLDGDKYGDVIAVALNLSPYRSL